MPPLVKRSNGPQPVEERPSTGKARLPSPTGHASSLRKGGGILGALHDLQSSRSASRSPGGDGGDGAPSPSIRETPDASSAANPVGPAIWSPSIGGSGFDIYIDGVNDLHVDDLEEARRKLESLGIGLVALDPRPTVEILDKRPAVPTQWSVWPENHGSGAYGYGMYIPGQGECRYTTLRHLYGELYSQGAKMPDDALDKLHGMTAGAFRDLRESIRKELGDDVVVCDKQPLPGLPVVALWPSATIPGGFSVRLGAGWDQRAGDLEEAKTLLRDHLASTGNPGPHDAEASRHRIRAMLTDMDNLAKAFDKKPPKKFKSTAIWPSKKVDHAFMVRTPSLLSDRPYDDFRFDDIDQAKLWLAKMESLNVILPRHYKEGEIGATVETTPAELQMLASYHKLDIKPLVVDGEEVGHVFRSADPAKQDASTVMIDCHGWGVDQGKFKKPDGKAFKFAAAENSFLWSNGEEFFRNLADDRVVFRHPSQTVDEPGREMTDYLLSGDASPVPNMAELVGEMHRQDSRKIFDLILLRPSAKVKFSSLMEAVRDAVGEDAYRNVVCHFCRPSERTAPNSGAAESYQPPRRRRMSDPTV
jgi:hypothetical protein